ncbi:MAG: hypothetical protein VW169_12270 [Rhodospirillaceae bacterium]|jgi:hypothetical protein
MTQSMTNDKKVSKLVGIIGRLSKLIQEENAILEQPGRSDGLREILQEKQNLSQVYEQQIKILDDENTLKQVDPETRRRLKEGLENFHALAEENQFRLMARMEATKRVFSVIQEAAKEYHGSRSTYGNSGSVDQPIRQAYSQPVSVGVSQDI